MSIIPNNIYIKVCGGGVKRKKVTYAVTFLKVVGGAYETRTRDPLRDRQIF